ncbi:unnamed protein product [Closterium sp. NIES-54]
MAWQLRPLQGEHLHLDAQGEHSTLAFVTCPLSLPSTWWHGMATTCKVSTALHCTSLHCTALLGGHSTLVDSILASEPNHLALQRGGMAWELRPLQGEHCTAKFALLAPCSLTRIREVPPCPAFPRLPRPHSLTPVPCPSAPLPSCLPAARYASQYDLSHFCPLNAMAFDHPNTLSCPPLLHLLSSIPSLPPPSSIPSPIPSQYDLSHFCPMNAIALNRLSFTLSSILSTPSLVPLPPCLHASHRFCPMNAVAFDHPDPSIFTGASTLPIL